jgi:hypothetical protein
MGFISDAFDSGAGGLLPQMYGQGDDAADAAKAAAKTSAAAQMEALNYLKDVDKIPRQYRESALGQLAGFSGIGKPGESAALFDSLKTDPFYGAIMSGRGAGEDAILRNAAATGGLRSGGSIEQLADYNTNLQNTALTTAYNNRISGLQGLAGISGNENAIAGGIAGIGNTLAQGQIAAAQAQQTANQNQTKNLMGLAQLGIMAFSDRRLKSNIKKIGSINGFNKYSWDWNSKAADLGLSGSAEGVMADEVELTRPDLVSEESGYKKVNYNGI